MRFLIFIFFCGYSFAQSSKFVDCTKINADIEINFDKKEIYGSEILEFQIAKIIDTIRIDAKNINCTAIQVNGKAVKFINKTDQFLLFEGFKLGRNLVSLKYIAQPKQCVYFTGNVNDLQIWTQGQGKYTSHWLPSFDDVNEKVIFGLSVSFGKDYKVISNGLLKKTFLKNNLKVWHYQMQKPMSSYLMMFAIGKFAKRTQKSTSGIALEEYLNQNDITKFDATYKYNKEIFDFLENELGVAYPWQIYRQVPVKDFLYGGMENTSATIFSQDYVVDAVGFNDKNYVNVNAHELAHQWFGDLITAKSGKHHWLQEGFATYYALLAEKNVFGDDYFNWKMYEMAEKIQRATKMDTIPILNEKASSLSFYQKGAWAIHVMRTKIGNQKFKIIVKNYLKKNQFKNVETSDFLDEVLKISDFDVKEFQREWLENPKFKIAEVLDILKKNNMMQQYFSISELKDVPFNSKKNKFELLLNSNAFYSIKQEIIEQLQKISFVDKKNLLQMAIKQNNVHVRQTIASTMVDFPDEFKDDYKTFLDDESYLTKEIALNVLWNRYPFEQSELLEKTKDWIGFNDYNLRILWLNLALRTTNYVLQDKTILYDELLQYSTTAFQSETRQNAINTLLFLDKNDQNVLPNLVSGLLSHRWQMVKFSRDKIRSMLRLKNFRIYFEKLSQNLNYSEQQFLNKLLKE